MVSSNPLTSRSAMLAVLSVFLVVGTSYWVKSERQFFNLSSCCVVLQLHLKRLLASTDGIIRLPCSGVAPYAAPIKILIFGSLYLQHLDKTWISVGGCWQFYKDLVKKRIGFELPEYPHISKTDVAEFSKKITKEQLTSGDWFNPKEPKEGDCVCMCSKVSLWNHVGFYIEKGMVIFAPIRPSHCPSWHGNSPYRRG